MQYALICPNEPVAGGYRVAQVTHEIFAVALPTYWMECADNVVAEEWYFDEQASCLKLFEKISVQFSPATQDEGLQNL